jgi:uncharacterized protein (DUF433 family)
MFEIKPGLKELSVKEVMKRYPLITAHIISESLGYATPTCAARILKDARAGRKNYCEWIDACYNRNPLRAVQDAIRFRHKHSGYMAEFKDAKALVERSIKDGEEPELASWF